MPRQPLSQLALNRARYRTNGRYVLFADVSEYYRSLYTHSITWALHGKTIGKSKRNDYTILGNRLDRAVRNLQDGQTNGIPVGPDTSFVIGEIILSAIDRQLQSEFKGIHGFRYYDDYELHFRKRSEAEECLPLLQKLLSDFGLQLNPNKTRIAELPQELEARWVHEIRDFDFGRGSSQTTRILRFFDRVFEYREELRDKYIIAYAISQVSERRWSPTDWALVQKLLFQAVLVEPSAMQQFLVALVKARIEGYSVDTKMLRDAVNMAVTEHAPLGHSSEVAWALWAAVAFELALGRQAATAVSSIDDSVIALLALDAQQRGRIKQGLDTGFWESLMTTDALMGPQWLLAYEASMKGWLPSVQGTDHVSANPAFRFLKSEGVSFYEEIKQPKKEDIPRIRNASRSNYDSDDEEFDPFDLGNHFEDDDDSLLDRL